MMQIQRREESSFLRISEKATQRRWHENWALRTYQKCAYYTGEGKAPRERQQCEQKQGGMKEHGRFGNDGYIDMARAKEEWPHMAWNNVGVVPLRRIDFIVRPVESHCRGLTWSNAHPRKVSVGSWWARDQAPGRGWPYLCLRHRWRGCGLRQWMQRWGGGTAP